MKIGIDDYLFKVVFVGDAGVGKTQIINKFVNNSFKEDYKTTTSASCVLKSVEYNGEKIKLELWDSPGQEKYKSITENFYKGSQLIVLVYTVDDKNTFENIQNWVNDVKNNTTENPRFLLVGNKCDLKEGRQVTKEEAEEYAKKYNMEFIEVSAKEGTNIDDMFNSSLLKILEDMKKEKNNNLTNNNTHNFEQKDLLDNQYIYDIKNKKNFCWMEYCSCCPCWEKTEGNGEEEEEVENDE